MSWPRILRLRTIEVLERDGALRVTFEVRDAAGCEFLAYATARPSGTLVDLQASDNDRAGTTGRPVVDELIAERVRRRLAHARAGGVIREFDRRQGRAR